MQPYIKTMAWGFWRERRSHIAMFITMAGAFSIFMSKYYPLLEHYDGEQVVAVFAMFIELFGIAGLMIISMTSSTMRLEIPDHLYTKPVSSRMLVGIYLSLTMISVIVIHLITAVLYTLVGHIDWPIVMPLIGLVTIVLCVHTIFWSLSAVPLVCCLAEMIVLGLFAGWCSEHLFRVKGFLALILRLDLAYIVLIAVCALGTSLHAVKLARCGERLNSARFWERLNQRLTALLPSNNRPFRTPQAAFFWVHFRTNGVILPTMNLLFVLIGLILCLVVSDKQDKVPTFMLGCAYFNLFILPIVGSLILHSGTKADNISTRPLSNR